MTSADAQDHDEDVEDFAYEMEQQGADPDAVAALRASIEHDEDDEDDDDAPPELWPENDEAFRVFTHCKWERQVVVGFESSATIFSGISGSEVQSVCTLLGIPSERWPEVLTKVRIAESVACPLLNARE